jgi:hypothetical protein
VDSHLIRWPSAVDSHLIRWPSAVDSHLIRWPSAVDSHLIRKTFFYLCLHACGDDSHIFD